MNYPYRFLISALASLALAASAFVAVSQPASNRYHIDESAEGLIPISFSGFGGEIDSVLKNDLQVVGFEITSPESASFLVTGSANGAVEGQVLERVSKAVRLPNRRYSGGTLRSQAHTFADDIVHELTGLTGIARTKIAFKGELSGNSEIYIADYDGANAVAVTRDRALVAAPCWSPGRRVLFYTSYKSGFPDVYSQNLDTGERRAIARYPGLNSSAAVSPDSRRVALILSKGGSPDLYLCDADGGNLKQLTNTREDEFSPCWSPDGRKICYGSRSGGSPALYVISADGGSPKRISISGAGSSLTEPDWSPDGKWIIFTVLRSAGFDLAMVPPEGGVATILVAGSDPSWAPNSRTVLFTRRDRGRQILSLLDVKTKRFKDVAQSLGNCSQPSWAK